MPDESLSPTLLEKVVYLGATLRSFPQAQQAAETLLELPLTTKRIERITERIGGERVAERDARVAAWQSLPLVAKLAAPPGVKAPRAVAISCDGGRLQRCDVSADDEKHWREYKAGSLMELETQEHASDPCPQLAAVFLEADRMERLTREIAQLAGRPHGEPPTASPVARESVARPIAAPEPRESVAASSDAAGPRYEPPVVRQRDVCATLGNSDAFGPQLAAWAWMLGFAAARIKALNGRIKGSEKFWSGRGGEAVLQLRADLLSDSLPLPAFWASRAAQASGTRSYALAA